MKSKLFFCAVMAVALLTSCEKFFMPKVTVVFNESMPEFTATMENEPATRTSLSDRDTYASLYWNAGDAISIFDGQNTAVYMTSDAYYSKAEFSCMNGWINNRASQFVAFYPSTITVDNMRLPSTQDYVDNGVLNFPMRAVSNTKDLAFKNLCGIIRFSLKSESGVQLSLSSIALSADKGLSGDFSVGEDSAAIVTGTDGVVLNCADPEKLYSSSATDFNVVVPQGEYNPLKVKICTPDGKEVNLESTSAVSVRRSGITRISLTLVKSAFDSSLETLPITDSDVDFIER